MRLIQIIRLACLLLFVPTFIFAQGPGCPAVDAGPDQTLSCQAGCFNLQASAFETGEATDYTVSSIPYAPPFPFTGGTQLFINIDDEFAPTIALPFTFCFYGNTYNQIVIGTNGVVTFDLTNSAGYCEWAFTGTLPGPDIYNNSINGAYHDMDPSVGFTADINYTVIGSVPCRTFIINYTNVPHFDCNNLTTTQQIVLYENTNAIEVYIQDKPTCFTWNSGNAVIGLQNANGTQGVVPPARNTGPWTATNEAWRFTPSGIQNYYINWYEMGGAFLAQSDSALVCPSDTTSYVAEAVYLACTGDTVLVYDTVTINFSPGYTLTTGHTDETCFGDCDGTINIVPVGGGTPFTYDIGNGPQISGQFQNLCAGSYSVTTTDGNNCSIIENFVINQVGTFSVSDTIITPVFCPGDTTGAIDITLDSAIAPITFAWSSGDTTEDVTNLVNGIYQVTITDSSNCPIVPSFVINSLTQIDFSSVVTQIGCFGTNDGAIDLTVSGGQPPYTYAWTGGSTTQDLSNLGGGSFTITITDANNCMDDTTFVLVEPTAISVGSLVTDVTCNGFTNGEIDLTISGGTSPYNFNWSNSSVTEDISNLAAGIYTVTITDDRGCTATASAIVSEPTALTASTSVTDVSCGGGTDGLIDLTVSGGTGAYSFNWSNGSTDEDADSLTVGMYSVTVTDSAGCTFTTTVNVAEPSSPSISLDVTNIDCFGAYNGQISSNVAGGTPPYTYLWSNTDTASNLINLSPITYTVKVTDGMGCTFESSAQLTEPDSLSLNGTVTIVSANGDGSDGAIDITVSGGIMPYGYNWSNGYTTQDLTNILPGDYVVTVTDSNGCEIVRAFTVDLELIDALLVPTAFTPNGDGVNDHLFAIVAGHYKLKAFKIFNRWGQEVFEATGSQADCEEPNETALCAWDGNFKSKEQPQGTYVYFLVADNTLTGEEEVLQGNITLIR